MAMAIPMQVMGEGAKEPTVRARTTRTRTATQLHGGHYAGAAQLAIPTADLTQLTDAELQRLARSLRAQALRGVREANGPAHACEAALRSRRSGNLDATPQTGERAALDLRPLAEWDEARPWWRFW
ncbi:MAG: hypothetical protein WBH52_18000 [Pseudomonas aeruginosa]